MNGKRAILRPMFIETILLLIMQRTRKPINNANCHPVHNYTLRPRSSLRMKIPQERLSLS